MKTRRRNLFRRGGESERHSFAILVVGAIVLVAGVLYLGFQWGRYAERNSAKESNVPRNTPPEGVSSSDIRTEITRYAVEPAQVPGIPPAPPGPPSAGDDLRKTESRATFPDTLSRKDPAPGLLEKKDSPPAARAQRDEPRNPERPEALQKQGATIAPGGRKYHLQVGAMKSAAAAEELRRRLEKRGYKVNVSRVKSQKQGEIYRVRVGPFPTREEAVKAMNTIRSGMKIDAILLKG